MTARKHIAPWALALALVSAAAATTLRVDGPGDGDSDSTDDFDSVGAALNALGPLGIDGTPDEIIVAVPEVIEPIPLRVNGGDVSAEGFAPVRDDLTLRGETGKPLVRAPRPGFERANTEIWLADGQHVTVRSLSPARRAQEVGNTILAVRAADESMPLEGAGLTVEDSVIMADASHPDAWPLSAFDLRLLPEGSALTLAIHGCQMGGDIFTAATVAAGWVSGEIVDSDFLAGMSEVLPHGSWGHAAGVSFEGPGRLTLTRVHATGSSNATGLNARFLSRGTPGAAELTLGPGCQVISPRDGAEVSLEGRAEDRFRIVGTAAEPVVIQGIVTGGGLLASGGPGLVEAEHLVVTGCGGAGLGLIFRSAPGGTWVFRGCLFAGNGKSVDNNTGNVRISRSIATDVSPADVLFEACTFHDVVDSLVSPQEPPSSPQLAAPTEFDLRSLGPTAATVTLRNCIISGDDTEDAFNMGGSPNATVVLENSALVFQGPYAVLHPNLTGAGRIVARGLRVENPAYGNVTVPPNGDSFDVTNPEFATWGPGGTPLTGWGDFEPSGL